ncbi:hypothetical protein BO86DRAFT_373713 [Aspergillus japonicus CBS 114.51]|uniref:Replication-associated protein ORF2/G2P domain-containing protein n=1 Tax=Aspergillus japonicus CBS 114.51 TaxID=1448312 RepID=A0A8T8WJZ2_ASPJA|nr:hypothetical protein BO86DRAFT_373713 [Aspergillus japonicus CBS 114.51]RAH76002.1 hypothetical protein BO86DRAFT_373713 [Aspergillus japonicus CBS 114.51]
MKKKEGVHSFWVFVTYSQCTIDDKEEFERLFRDALKQFAPQAKYFGCRERHEEKGIHYHVLVNLGFQPTWTMERARARFTVIGNMSKSINLTPNRSANMWRFVRNHVEYVQKNGDVFGKAFSVKPGGERKQLWREYKPVELKKE